MSAYKETDLDSLSAVVSGAVTLNLQQCAELFESEYEGISHRGTLLCAG